MLKRILTALVLLLSFSYAIDLVSPPISGVNNGDVIEAGTIGPGQTLSIEVIPTVTTGGIYGKGGTFDIAYVSDLPPGWSGKNSKLYQNPLQVTITAAPDAAEGNYTTMVTVVNENNGEGLGNISFMVRIHITHDVMAFDVSPSSLTIGPGQPARFAITITNKASTSDVFDVSSVGAKRWEFVKPVFVPARSSKTIYYEIAAQEEGTYGFTINVVSEASKLISGSQNITLQVRPDLIGDYKATNNGVVIFPIFESGVYSLAGLIANLFGYS